MQLTLSHNRATRDAVRDFLQARIQIQHLCWRRLFPLEGCPQNFGSAGRHLHAYFRIIAALKERGHANEADIIIPHHGVLGIATGDFEHVLKDCGHVSDIVPFGNSLRDLEYYPQNFPVQSSRKSPSYHYYRGCVANTPGSFRVGTPGTSSPSAVTTHPSFRTAGN